MLNSRISTGLEGRGGAVCFASDCPSEPRKNPLTRQEHADAAVQRPAGHACSPGLPSAAHRPAKDTARCGQAAVRTLLWLASRRPRDTGSPSYCTRHLAAPHRCDSRNPHVPT